jgi:hypothetical protein
MAPKTSEIAAAVPGILNEGSHNTTVNQPRLAQLTPLCSVEKNRYFGKQNPHF